MVILVLDSVDFETAYCDSASRHHWQQCHVSSHGWRDVSFG